MVDAADAIVLGTLGSTITEGSEVLRPIMDATLEAAYPELLTPENLTSVPFSDQEVEVDQVLLAHGDIAVNEVVVVRADGTADEADEYGFPWPIEDRQYLWFLAYDADNGVYGVVQCVFLGGAVVVDVGNVPLPVATGTAPADFLAAVEGAVQ
jgi:hypothetical protein